MTGTGSMGLRLRRVVDRSGSMLPFTKRKKERKKERYFRGAKGDFGENTRG